MDSQTVLVACSVCGRPTNITQHALQHSGRLVATHGTCVGVRRGVQPGIELIAGDERCDAQYEQQLTDEARERWEAQRPQRDRQREAARAQLSVGQRLDVALQALGTLSAVGARPVARESPTSDEERAPGPPRTDPPDVTAHMNIITWHVQQIERELDTARGLARPAAGGLQTSEEKDLIIWEEFMGWRAEDVCVSAPYLGTHPRTIMRSREREAKRRKVKVRLVDGTILGPLIEGA